MTASGLDTVCGFGDESEVEVGFGVGVDGT